MVTFFLINTLSFSQVIFYDSFEENFDTSGTVRVYPMDGWDNSCVWGLYESQSKAGLYSWVNKCLGKCIPCYELDNPHIKCNGWYTPTIGSSDYFHRDSPVGTEYTKVPNIRIWSGEENSGPPKRELREPAGYNGNNNENAYVGFSTVDLRINNGFDRYREYIQRKLPAKLENDKIYEVSFLVSFAKGDNVIRCAYFKRIGAYFSKEPIVFLYDQVVDGAMVDVLYDTIIGGQKRYVNPQINSKYYLDGTADSNGNNGWREIKGRIKGNDFWYITIGNFELENWMDYRIDTVWNPTGSLDSYKRNAYYFIDSLVIKDVTNPFNCICSTPAYNTSIKPSKNQNDVGKCCYDFKLYVDLDTNNYFCDLYGIRILYRKNADTTYYLAYEHLEQILKGDSLIIEICLEQSADPFPHDYFTFKFDFLDSDSSIMCSDYSEYYCHCNCGDNPGGRPWGSDGTLHYYEPRKINDSNSCCYDIYLINPADCLSAIDYNVIKIEPKDKNYEDMIISSGDFQFKIDSTIYQYNKVYYWERPDSVGLFPFDTLFIGTICLDNGTETKEISLNNASEIFRGCRNKTISLSCLDSTTNCCDSIKIDLVTPSAVPDHSCCRILRISHSQSFDNICDIHRILIYKNDSLIPSDSLVSLAPLYFSQEGYLITVVCAGLKLGSIDLGKVKVEFYNRFDSLICTKEDSFTCSYAPPIGHHNSKLDELIEDELNCIVYPNPSNSDIRVLIKVGFILGKRIEVINTIGQSVLIETNYKILDDQAIEFEINRGSLSSGVYYIRFLNINGEVVTIPFVLNY